LRRAAPIAAAFGLGAAAAHGANLARWPQNKLPPGVVERRSVMTDEQRARLAAVAAEDRYVRGVRSYCEKAGGLAFNAKDSYVLQRSVAM
jgi:hypothetical protein